MISLSRLQRAALFFVSASAYLAWYSGFGERLEAQDIVGAPAPSITLAPRFPPPHLSAVIIRDPFAGAPDTSVRSDTETRIDAPSLAQATFTTHATPGNGMVPNISSSGVGEVSTVSAVPDIATARNGSPDGAPAVLVVRATIVGRNPVAYVANGTMMDIVRVGDRLGDRRIARIDLRGIAFTDGSRLDLPGAFAAPAPSAPKVANTITLKLDDLRKLVQPARQQSPPLAPGAGASPGSVTPVAPSAPAPAGTFPSPGPLPTIDQRGIPVGTNPTPSANGPTPYPNPFPYAPPAPPHP